MATKAKDARGNTTTYSYCFAEADGYTAEYALTEIRYGGFEGPITAPPSRAVRFVVGTKDPADIRVHYARGMALQRSLQLDEIQMFGPDEVLVRRYGFTYELSPTTQRTLLTSVEECGSDAVCTPPTRFQYKRDEPGFKRIATRVAAPVSRRASPMLFDLTGDGLDDLVVPDANPALSTPQHGMGSENETRSLPGRCRSTTTAAAGPISSCRWLGTYGGLLAPDRGRWRRPLPEGGLRQCRRDRAELRPEDNPLAPCVQRYDYAPNGNLTFKSDAGVLAYDDPAHPHAVTSAGGGDRFGYDLIGNQIARPGSVVVRYTPFDLPETITRGASTISFGHDGDQTRIRKTTPAEETLYPGDLYERVARAGSAAAEHRYFVRSPERVVAVVTRGGPSPGTRYLHADPLGSIHAVTNDRGAVEERRSYDAYGQRRNPTWGEPAPASFTSKTTRGFTGHETDEALGLVNMKGRVMDPRLGRFTTTAPVVSSLWNGQALNSYSYVRNRPLTLVDPTGFTDEPSQALSRPPGLEGAPAATRGITVWVFGQSRRPPPPPEKKGQKKKGQKRRVRRTPARRWHPPPGARRHRRSMPRCPDAH